MFIQDQVLMIVSMPWSSMMDRGRRLMKNASFTAVLAWWAVFWSFLAVDKSRGYSKVMNIRVRLDPVIMAVGCITSTWSCTKTFWFLKPMDELLSFRSIRVSLGIQPRGWKLAVSIAAEPLSVNKRSLTSIFRITI